MVTITSTTSHIKFSDGGDFQLEVPKSMISLSLKRDYLVFGFQLTGNGPGKLTFHYSDVDSPSAGSASDLFSLLSTALSTGAYQVFIATASQTDFVVTDFTVTSNVKVFVAGAFVSTGWSTSGQTIQFTSGLPVGKEVVIMS